VIKREIRRTKKIKELKILENKEIKRKEYNK